MNKKKEYLFGLKLGLPVVFGFIPVGIAYGIMAREAGMSIAQTICMSLFVFAGAAEIMSTGMIAEGAGVAAIIIATFLLNLRHLIMSTCVFDKMKPGKGPLKCVLAFGVTDESFGIYTNATRAYSPITFLGMITVTYSSWCIGSAIGAIVGSNLPGIISSSFEIALYAMFISMVLPNCKRSYRITILIVVTALMNILLNLWIPSHWALITSTLVCAFIGIFFVDPEEKDGWKKKKNSDTLVSLNPSQDLEVQEND